MTAGRKYLKVNLCYFWLNMDKEIIGSVSDKRNILQMQFHELTMNLWNSGKFHAWKKQHPLSSIYLISILLKPTYETFQNEGGSHEHGNDVQLNCDLTWVLASAVNSSAAICVQTSLIPAIQVQCAHTTYPEEYVAIHTFKGVVDRFWKCFTCNINTENLHAK